MKVSVRSKRAMLGRAAVLAALAMCVLGALSTPAFAVTQGAGWELTAHSEPTNFGQPVNDVQEVAVEAMGGAFALIFNEHETTTIPFGASAVTVQANLEALANIGEGNVEVTGGPGRYVVTFTGILGDRPETALEANGAGLTGGTHSATATRKIRGAVSGTIAVEVFNVGAAASHGTITVTDTLPAGVTASDAGNLTMPRSGVEPLIDHSLWDCTGDGSGTAPHLLGATVVTCKNNPNSLSEIAGGGGLPTFTFAQGPNVQPMLGISVNVQAGIQEGSQTNHVTIAGGGAPTAASTQDPVTISSSPPPFGFVGFDGWFSNADGTLDTQAGSHPYEATFSLDLASVLPARNNQAELQEQRLVPAGGEVRDIEVELPPGFVADPAAVPQCPRGQFDAAGTCPLASEIGTFEVWNAGLGALIIFPVYNLLPPLGVPAEFGFNFSGINTFLDSTVRSGSDYGIMTHIDNVAQRQVVDSVLTLWGDPRDPTHTIWRNGNGGGCSPEQLLDPSALLCKNVSSLPRAFLTLPTACAAAQPFVIRANTWGNANAKSEKVFLSHDSNHNESGFTGCEHLSFGPQITASPDTSDADTPTGLTVEVKPPLGGFEEVNGISSSDIQNTKVTLPEGLVINPGQAAGLQACQPPQDGLTTQAEKEKGEENSGPAECPNASKVGMVSIKTPLLEGTVEKVFQGNVYVLQSNPPELKLLVAASADGVNLKLVGIVHLNEQTGQLTTTFSGTPELPFTVFKLSFSGGPQAALDTPPQCGTYTTTADFTPWASPFVSDFNTTAAFGITAGPGGGPCPSNPMPFAPTMIVGSTTDQAGGFTNFSLLLQRGDGQQRIEKLQFKEPAGLAGLISSVPLCPEPQAAAGTCSEASHIGHAVVASGPGPYPLVLPQPGAPELPIYLTGPYKGAPFGLSIVTPVIAGPFNLGTIITRAKIDVDPVTAQITISTDPLPQIVAGVPTDLRSINSIIDRPGFLFNPTNCTAAAFTGTATSAGGAASAPIASHFGVGSCQSLRFKPRFSVSASGRNSKAGGASLDVKVVYPSEPQGSEANIAKVKVDLPKQLPSRLTTLQKACTAAQFGANPAGCPSASVVGHAVVHTPVLPVPLEGPAYFVSNGGEAFPNLIMVLQGYGVTVDLVGDTFINKQGITSSTFNATPDVPFSTFELKLPQGPYSALATDVPPSAQYSLCGQKLTMLTELVAQNGAVINQSTPVGISGCAKKKSLTRAQKLAAALRVCHKKHGHKRAVCERQARKRYGPGRSKKNIKKK
jgi:hypothetical protein